MADDGTELDRFVTGAAVAWARLTTLQMNAMQGWMRQVVDILETESHIESIGANHQFVEWSKPAATLRPTRFTADGDPSRYVEYPDVIVDPEVLHPGTTDVWVRIVDMTIVDGSYRGSVEADGETVIDQIGIMVMGPMTGGP